ncbi:hypothetical protein H0S57_05095 [Acinetobacter johnsonii]|uniref:Uncharacterized protein n=1 Tax=Acinetobacter johnsonii TaxID=40214 RepID=A0A2W5CGT7_ACIJO|nr:MULTISPECIES: hypothetical protein [Acinetobacter]MBV7307635.1 hypothetical protein [Acinetobacter sp. CWB-G5]MDH0712146.1 hypothetical protein [Acinetobacter johnsonii]PZO93438.1 MAG: hypothetical protein DI631_06485 [Acinetobacter johnsonii]QPF35984.1 hypothetical protein H0S57_05095 [Acinetobacter johnsonii]RSE23651.1 hypothetical protein EGT73_08250 [Acinetobacter johnsonii]
MTDPNGVLKFSLGLDQLSFEMDGQRILLDQGLSFIQSNSMRHEVLDELAIESMIYVIEEILESVPIHYGQPKNAISADDLFQQVLTLFFQNQHSIDRVQLESGFNAFIERREYYVSKVADDGLSSLVYFIVLREMMHHWNVVEIQLEQF